MKEPGARAGLGRESVEFAKSKLSMDNQWMTPMTDCLVAFAVASGMSDTDAAARAQTAMDAYLAGFEDDPDGAVDALRELQAAFLEMNLDSGPAELIKQDLSARITELERGQR